MSEKSYNISANTNRLQTWNNNSPFAQRHAITLFVVSVITLFALSYALTRFAAFLGDQGASDLVKKIDGFFTDASWESSNPVYVALGAVIVMSLAIDMHRRSKLNQSTKPPKDGVESESTDKSDAHRPISGQRKISHYPRTCLSAILWAREELRKHNDLANQKNSWYQLNSGVPSHHFDCGVAEGTTQPASKEIAQLTTLYETIYYPALGTALSQSGNDWTNQDVVDACDKLMKISYAIGVLSLESLPDFAMKKDRTPEKALTFQDSYFCKTYFYCPQTYHSIRSGTASVSHTEANHFYEANPDNAVDQQANARRSWNELYNDYCRRVREYADETKLNQKDPKFVDWIKVDVSEDDYKNPDLQH